MKAPNIPPGLAEEIQRRLQNGEPLPPGVVGVPKGSGMPPGMMPPGGPQRNLQDEQKKMKFIQNNPIPDGDEGVQMMRDLHNCPIPEKAVQINGLMQQLVKFDSSSEEEDGEVEDKLVKGMTLALRAPKMCKKQISKRVVCDFTKDERQVEINDRLGVMEKEAMDLQGKLQELQREAQTLLEERWTRAVKQSGLDPSQYCYEIDEDAQKINLVSIDCEGCECSSGIETVTGEIQAMLQKHQQEGTK